MSEHDAAIIQLAIEVVCGKVFGDHSAPAADYDWLDFAEESEPYVFSAKGDKVAALIRALHQAGYLKDREVSTKEDRRRCGIRTAYWYQKYGLERQKKAAPAARRPRKS